MEDKKRHGFVHTEVSPFDDDEYPIEDDLYEDDCDDFDDTEWEEEIERDCILEDPRKIYEHLKQYVYGQDEACKATALILYNHIHHRPQRALYCGPAGCGKTFIWDIVKRDLYEYVLFTNSATLSKTGFTGTNKTCSILYDVEDVNADYILVFDEFDKICAPSHSYGGDNISAQIQSELLALVQPSIPHIRLHQSQSGESKVLKISDYSWIFCGSFAVKANEIAESKSTSGIGFYSERHETKAFDEKLAIQDVIDFGLITELASRIQRVVNLRPLTVEDYKYLISDFENSPIRRIETEYRFEDGFLKKIVNNERLIEIATKAYKSGLGIRNTYSQITQLTDDYIFEHFDEYASYN